MHAVVVMTQVLPVFRGPLSHKSLELNKFRQYLDIILDDQKGFVGYVKSSTISSLYFILASGSPDHITGCSMCKRPKACSYGWY